MRSSALVVLAATLAAIAQPATAYRRNGQERFYVANKNNQHAVNVDNVDAEQKNTGKKLVGYYTYWSSLEPQNIPGDALTHINYAFANIDNAGRCVVGNPASDTDRVYGIIDECGCCAKGKYNRLYQLRKEYPHLQTLLSVGGATWSSNFAFFSSTQQGRQTLASSCIRIMLDYGFDGVDLDWEFPQNQQEANNYNLLLQEFRRQYQQLSDGSRYLLTIATSVDQDKLNYHPLRDMANTLDFFNLMTYDFSVGFTRARHQAPLYASDKDPDPWPKERYYVDHVVQQFISSGVPKDKIVVGIPVYGHSFEVNTGDSGNGGIFQQQRCGRDCQGFVSYADVVSNKLRQGYQKYFDPRAVASWIYNPQSGGLVSYDDLNVVGKKVDYINNNALGGAMFWDLDMDTTDGNSIVKFTAKQLKGVNWNFRGPYCTNYSPFCNIKCVGKAEDNVFVAAVVGQ